MGGTGTQPGDWIRPSGGRILVAVKVVTGASRSLPSGMRDGCLLVRLAAQPEKGKANEELRACIAKALGIPKSEVELTAGATSRRKTISLAAGLEPRIRALAAEAGP